MGKIGVRMPKRKVGSALFLTSLCASLFGCTSSQRKSAQAPPSLSARVLTGNLAPVRDPSMAFQHGRYFMYSTDPPATDKVSGHIPVRCSRDGSEWSACGHIFESMPAWVHAVLPQVDHLWAPDISFFGGRYYLYYCASSLGSQDSAIGVATNTTLDPSDRTYRWVDQGQVLASKRGDDFNAIDPSIFVTENRVLLTYGSYWSGVKQRLIDPSNGMLSSSNRTSRNLAATSKGSDEVIEGASILRRGRFFYLFLSRGLCCETDIDRDSYSEIVGRSAHPTGPFVDADGRPLLKGGGTLIAQADNIWAAPGGASAFHDPATGIDLLVFHALQRGKQGRATLRIEPIKWVRDWPTLTSGLLTSKLPLLAATARSGKALCPTQHSEERRGT